MAIRIKMDVDFGEIFYVKTDVDQFPHQLVGVVTMPGNDGKTVTKFILSYYGDIVTVWDFETTRTPDTKMMLDIKKDDDD